MRLIEGKIFYNKPWYGSYKSMLERCYREKSSNYNIYGGNYDGVNLQGYSQASYQEQIEQLNSITSLYLITDEDYIKRSHSLDTGIIGYNGYTEEVGLYYSKDLNFTIVD